MVSQHAPANLPNDPDKGILGRQAKEVANDVQFANWADKISLEMAAVHNIAEGAFQPT